MRLWEFDINPSFWSAALAAAFIRVATSERHSISRSLIIVAIAIFSAWVGTPPVLAWLNLPSDYETVVAAVCALTGEGIMRWLINVSKDPLQLLAMWRGQRSDGK